MLYAMVAVVTGRPGAGKSTLASLLASALGRPLVTRDGIKEAMLQELGMDMAGDRGLALHATETFFAEVLRLATGGEPAHRATCTRLACGGR